MAFLWKLSIPFLITLQFTGFFCYRKAGPLLVAWSVYATLQLVLQAWNNYSESKAQLEASQLNIALLGMYCLRLSDWLSAILFYGVTWRSSSTVVSDLKILDDTFSKYFTRSNKWFVALSVIVWTGVWLVFLGIRIYGWPYQLTLAAVSGLFGARKLPVSVLEFANNLLVALFQLDAIGRITLHSFIIFLAFISAVTVYRLKEAVTKVTDHKAFATITAECITLWSIIKKLDKCFSAVSFILCLNLVGFLVYDSFEMSRKLALTKSFTTCTSDLVFISCHLLLFGTHVTMLAVLTEKSRALHTAIKGNLRGQIRLQDLSESDAVNQLQPTPFTILKLIITRESAMGALTGILGYIMLYAEAAGKDVKTDKSYGANSSAEI